MSCDPQKYNDILEEYGYAQAEEYKHSCEEYEADTLYHDWVNSFHKLDLIQLGHKHRFIKGRTDPTIE